MTSRMLTAKAEVISTDLERTQEPAEILGLLKQFGCTDEDIAIVTRTHVRTVRRWKAASPGTSAATRLGQLRNLVVRLRDSDALTDLGILWWLRHPNRLLEDYSPLAVTGADGFRSVRAAAICFIDTEKGFEAPLTEQVRETLKHCEASPALVSDDRGDVEEESSLARPQLSSV